MNVRTRRAAGGVVWGVGFVVALVWGALDTAGVEGAGYGFAPPVTVAPLETGRILEVPVQLHDPVRPDQVVVKMDPAPIEAERQVAMAQLLAVQEDAASSAMNDARRFAEGMESVAVNRAKLAAGLQEDLALAETLRERSAIEEGLAGTGASSTQAVAEWQRQLRVVEARIAATRGALAVASDAAAKAMERQEDLVRTGQWAAVAATRTVELLEGRIARADLRAGIEGQVTWIYRSAGDVVPAGEPLLQIRRTGTTEVVAFFPPSAVAGLEAGDDASVKRSTGQVVQGHLRSVGSGPQPLPTHLWKLPSWPEYGVPVVVDLDAEIAPDEAVVVRI
jgi:multidrug resistance efflux pump